MLVVDEQRCDVCGTCISVCRFGALLLTDKLHVDTSACRSCNCCVRVCPVGALSFSEDADVAEALGESKEVR